MFQSECLSSTRFTTKIRIMLLALQDKSLFASFKFWSDLVMVGQGKLMPGSGYASDARANVQHHNSYGNI